MTKEDLRNKGKKIKIGLVGCGRISKNHIKSISLNSEFCELVALCDVNKKNLENSYELTKQLFDEKDLVKIMRFYEFTDLVEASKKNINKLDLLVLCTPSGLHPKQTIEAANAGINICTEKPMATNIDDGIAMIRECEKNKVKLFEVKQNRFSRTLKLLKKQIDEGRFGNLSLVTINVFWQRPQSYYNQENWRGTRKLDGGVLMNQANHYIDLVTWLFGPVEKINAFMTTLGRSIEVEDTATLQIKWKAGFLGTMSVTMLTYPENLEGSITVLGEKGTARIGGKAVNKIEHWEFKDKNVNDNEIINATNETTKSLGFGHPLFYKDMLENLQDKEKEIDFNDLFQSLELLLATYESAEKQKIMSLPLYKRE